MNPGEVLGMQIEQFWLLEKNINRIRAQENLERLNVLAGSQSKDGYESLHARFLDEIGVVTREQPKLDSEGLGKLRDLQQGPM